MLVTARQKKQDELKRALAVHGISLPLPKGRFGAINRYMSSDKEDDVEEVAQRAAEERFLYGYTNYVGEVAEIRSSAILQSNDVEDVCIMAEEEAISVKPYPTSPNDWPWMREYRAQQRWMAILRLHRWTKMVTAKWVEQSEYYQPSGRFVQEVTCRGWDLTVSR